MPRFVIHSSKRTRSVPLGTYATIGRTPDNRIAIPSTTVSKHHARILRDDAGTWFVEDLGSANGTFVDGRRVKRAKLQDGAKLRLGRIRCEFSLEGDSEGRDTRVKLSETESAIHLESQVSKVPEFLPENEIDDDDLLRADYERLRLTYEIQRDISIDTSIDDVLHRILDRASEFLNYDLGIVLLSDGQGGLAPRAQRVSSACESFTVSSTLLQHVMRERKGVLASDVQSDERFSDDDSIMVRGIRSSIAVPFLRDDQLLGALALESFVTGNVFTDKDLHLITSIANHTAQLIHNALLHEEIQLLFESAVGTLSAMVDAKHRLTAGHSKRVTEFALYIAEELGLSSGELEAVKYAGLLHDIGKIGIPDRVLLKDGPFTPDDRQIMNTHPERTAEILRTFRFPPRLAAVPHIASCHHERIDGTGYPFGLKGRDLQVGAKVLAVADVFDALTSRRDYPKYTASETLGPEPMPLPKVFDIIRTGTGKQFDRAVVVAFFGCLPQILRTLRDDGRFGDEYVEEGLAALELQDGLES